MMKTNVYIFTFEGDRELVPMCVAALKHSAGALGEGDSVHVCVVDDASALAYESEQAALQATGADAYVRTEFDRCGNLNKAACIRGMLELYDTAPDDCDWVMQVDSDTLLRSFEHLRGADADIVGIGSYDVVTDKKHTPYIDFVCGSGMAIKRGHVRALVELINSGEYDGRIDAGNGCSDRVICALSRIAKGRHAIYWRENTKKVTEDLDFCESRLTLERVGSEHAQRALLLHCDHRLCEKREDTVPIMRAAFERYFGDAGQDGGKSRARRLWAATSAGREDNAMMN